MRTLLCLMAAAVVFFGDALAQNFNWAETIFLAGRTEESSDNEAYTAANDSNIYIAGKFKNQVCLITEVIESKGGYDIFLADYDADGNLFWVISVGGQGDDIAKAVAVLSNGDVVITGTFEGSVDFGGQILKASRKNNLFVACYDEHGKLKWAQRGGGVSALHPVDTGTGIAVDGNDNIYVCGGFYGADDKGDYTKPGVCSFGDYQVQNCAQANNSFAAKFSSDGKVQWVSIIAHYGLGVANGICVDGEGNAYITGVCSATFAFGAKVMNSNGIADIYVARFNADGSHGWFQQFGGGEKFNPANALKYMDAFEYGSGICTDRKGNLYVAGQFVDKVNFGSVTLKAKGGADAFVMSIDYNGGVKWASASGSKHLEWVKAIQIDSEDNIYIAGVNSEYGGLDFDAVGTKTSRGIGSVEKISGKDGSKMWGAGAGSWGLSLTPYGKDDMVMIGSFANQVKFNNKITLDIKGKLKKTENLTKKIEVKTYEAGYGLYMTKIKG